MPSFDGGHYFLTALAPIRPGPSDEADPITGARRSHRHLLAQRLALLPTGEQTRNSAGAGSDAPFARNDRTHLARFVIIAAPHFNGRTSGDTLLTMSTDPLAAQPVDSLTTAYLLFAADADTATGGAEGLKSYTDALWTGMSAELTDIFGHCVGFDGVATAGDFHDYIRRCEIETTMPFNDYWAYDELRQAKDNVPPLNLLLTFAKAAGAAIALWIAALLVNSVAAVAGWHGGFARGVAKVAAWGLPVSLLLIAVVALCVWAAYGSVVRRSAQPFPASPGGSLRAVLKGLYLKEHFVRFAAQAQGHDDATLHAAFGKFIERHRPADPAPTQTPGVMGVDTAGSYL